MAHTVHTGKGMTLTFNGKTVQGLRVVDIDDKGTPAPPMIDITDSAVTVYTETADPMGSPEPPKCKVKVECLDSAIAYAQDDLVKQALNQVGVMAFASSATTDDNKWDHTAIEFIRRTTTITWEEPATVAYEFEANTNGAWGKVA